MAVSTRPISAIIKVKISIRTTTFHQGSGLTAAVDTPMATSLNAIIASAVSTCYNDLASPQTHHKVVLPSMFPNWRQIFYLYQVNTWIKYQRPITYLYTFPILFVIVSQCFIEKPFTDSKIR